jgi:hypothetical protein
LEDVKAGQFRAEVEPQELGKLVVDDDSVGRHIQVHLTSSHAQAGQQQQTASQHPHHLSY